MEEHGALDRRDVDRREVDPAAAADLDRRPEELGRHARALDRGERQASARIAELPFGVRVAIAIEDEVEAGARPELDQVERQARLAGKGEKGGNERDATLRLVRLNALLPDESAERYVIGCKCRRKVVPFP